MKTILYRRPDGKIVPANVLCSTGEATLSLVRSKEEETPDSLIIAHDDDLDGVYEDTEMNWFNVEPKEVVEIAKHLNALRTKEEELR